MMEIIDLVAQLRSEKWPSRKLDIMIGELAGYRKANDTKYPKFSWHHPGGKVARLPKFTESIQDAYELLQLISPGNIGGCSWEDGDATAKIEDGPFCRAATPALAICIAALVELYKKSGRVPSGEI